MKKMKYNPKNHNRKSIRLKGYDYSQAGLYFVTICCQNKTHFYGKITDGKMILNEAGNMIAKWYDELENKFTDIKCHEMIVMPNHFHGIIQNVGADLRVCPNIWGEHGGSSQRGLFQQWGEHGGSFQQWGEHGGSSLHRVVQWFKTMTTNEYIRNVKLNNWQRFDGKLWQRNYWEHIIRNEKSYINISKYIISNPINWKNDTLNLIK